MANQMKQKSGLPLPMWAKDYAGLAFFAILLFGAVNFYADQRYYLQVLCSIGVAIIVATGLNLIIGYIGQVALGHAGFVALGGYMVGLLLGRVTGKTNWIDYLYVRKTAGFQPEERDNLTKAVAARNEALQNANNILLIFLIITVVLTIALSFFFYLRWQQLKRTGEVAQKHFWQNSGLMRNASRVFGIVGLIGAVVLYVLTALSHTPTSEGLPWVWFAVLVSIFGILYTLCDQAARQAARNTGRLRVSFWDRPSIVKSWFLSSLIGGGTLTAFFLLMYFVGFWTLQNFWFALLLGAVVTGLFGWVLALPALRVKGPYLSMVTIAFGTIVFEVVNSSSLTNVLGAQSGLGRLPYPMTERNPQTDLIYPSLNDQTRNAEFFWTAIIISAFAIFVMYIVRSFMRSRWGRSLIAIRENEIGAGSVGINVTRTKTLAFVMSASLSGVGGVLLAYAFGSIDPSFSVLSVSISYVTMLIMGGSGTLYGPAAGAILITIIPEFLKNITVTGKETYVFAFQGANGYLTPAILAVLIIAWLVVKLALRKPGIAKYIGIAAGLVVILNSYEIFKSLTNALGSFNGVGFVKINFDISDWLIILFFYLTIVGGVVITGGETRKFAVRTIAAAGILFIPQFYKLAFGLARSDDASTFKAVTVLLTMYGAILLYFLYLVPNGIGGLIGKYIDRFFPTSHKLEQKRQATSKQTASADASEPERAVSTKQPNLSFHKQKSVQTGQLLEVLKTTRNFKGLRAVDSVEMEVQAGSVHALIGPNGAGKTTLLNLISGLYPVSAGEILFKNERIDGLKTHRIAEEGISRTFQNLQVFGDMTVIENVMVGFHLHTRQGFWATLLGLPQVRLEESRIESLAMELLEFVGLADRAYNKARDLPYGYQRLLEIARALAVEPQLLLLDEPAAGLNPQEVEDMVRLIRKIKNEGVTVLLIEHHMDLVMEISDKLTVLDYGKKIEEGGPAHVQGSPKVKEAYFGPEVILDVRS